jgi:hypothetical protein
LEVLRRCWIAGLYLCNGLPAMLNIFFLFFGFREKIQGSLAQLQILVLPWQIFLASITLERRTRDF